MVSQRDIAPARAALRERLGGQIVVRETEDGIRFETEAASTELALRLAAGGSYENLVAGARFGNYLRSDSEPICLLTITR